jgi:hypothetical protein
MARTVAPVDLIPAEMTEIEVSLPDKGKMYQLSFRLPGQPGLFIPVNDDD